jgi:hypothetical protein
MEYQLVYSDPQCTSKRLGGLAQVLFLVVLKVSLAKIIVAFVAMPS